MRIRSRTGSDGEVEPMPEGAPATGAGTSMDPSAVAAVGQEFQQFSEAVREASGYAELDGLTPGHFGGRPEWQQSGQKFMAAVRQMATSLAAAAAFTGSVVTAMQQTVAASVGTDEANARSLTAAGRGEPV